MGKRIKIRPGDIFAFDRYEGTFGFGRLLLDVNEQCLKKRMLDPGSALLMFEDAVLIEMFRESAPEPSGDPVDVIVNGAFIDADLLRGGYWPIFANRAVDPSLVGFPENLTLVGIASRFSCGEIDLKSPLQKPEVRRLDVFPTQLSADSIVETSLFYSGNSGTPSAGVVAPKLRNSDLRFHEDREKVYELLGEDPSLTYFEMALKHGHDLKRFYE